MAVTAQESYYESLGRQSGLPYADPKLDYIETEPDMTKPVNENIDKEIKDTRQFFQDNINIFNETQKARSNRLKDQAIIRIMRNRNVIISTKLNRSVVRR